MGDETRPVSEQVVPAGARDPARKVQGDVSAAARPPARIGRYPVAGELGRGGMGVVYLAEDPRLERRIAIKVLPLRLAEDITRRRQLEHEARLLAALNHPNIATIYSIEDVADGLFLTMEYVEGETLRDRIATTPLPFEETVQICRQIARAVEAAHQKQIVHRDLKPLNVKVTTDGVVKVLDFGLAELEVDLRPVGSGHATTRRSIAGTPGYMSPEQLQQGRDDWRTDIWAFGCILYECLTGRQAFAGATLDEILTATLEGAPDWSALPADTMKPITELLVRCLDKDASRRPRSMLEVRRHLDECAELTARARLRPRRLERDVPSNNLPVQLTSFVGRVQVLREVEELVRQHRFVTLTGTGGCGKSRIACEVADRSLPGFPDGAWLAELAPLSLGTHVARATAAMFGLQEEARRPIVDTLAGFLRGRSTLLILDNCEHVLDHCASLVDSLLRSCAELHVVATSREPLGVPGELVYRIRPLELPPADIEPAMDSVATTEAVRLFVDRATHASQGAFRLTSANCSLVTEICRRLDGIPLAIELAAARARTLGVHDIAERLRDRFRLLTVGPRTALERHQTLKALIDWSHEQLSDQEQLLLRRLSVFAGGCTLAAAEAIGTGAGVEGWEVLDLLTRLVDKSLVEIDVGREGASDATRYRLLETIREYASLKLAESGERGRVLDRHRSFFIALADEARPDLGEVNRKALDELDDEYGNLVIAAEGCLQGEVDLDGGFRLGRSLLPYWYSRGYWSEGRRYYERLLDHWSAGEPDLRRAEMMDAAAWLSLQQGDYESARPLAEASLAVCRELGDGRKAADALETLGSVARGTGDYAQAAALYQESLALYREAGSSRGTAALLHHLGGVALARGEDERARGLYEESLALWREIGDRLWTSILLNRRAVLAERAGDYEQAHTLHAESLAIQRLLSSKPEIAASLASLGGIAIARGAMTDARRFYEESLAIRRDLGDQTGIAYALGGLGNVAHELGEYDRATALYEEALRITRQSGDRSGIARFIDQLGTVARIQGDVDRAWELYQEAVDLQREIGEQQGLAWALIGLGATASDRGDHETAGGLLTESLTLLRDLGDIGDRSYIATALARLAVVAGRRSRPARAARLRAGAAELARTIGFRFYVIDRQRLDELDALIARSLDAEARVLESQAGRDMVLDDLMRLALEGTGDHAGSPEPD